SIRSRAQRALRPAARAAWASITETSLSRSASTSASGSGSDMKSMNARRVFPSPLPRVKAMAKLRAAALVSIVMLSAACDDFLDVNDNPNAPETVTANLYLPPMLHWMATAPQFDGRFVGRYTEQWVIPHTTGVPNIWSRMGYDRSSDNGAQLWRDVYWTFGQNLVDLMTKAEAEERWDVLGVGYVLKGWGWLMITGLHGEIIVQQAFDVTRFEFDYDTQEFTYQEIIRLFDEAIANLQRTDGSVDAG